jgi:hypothetical protein
MNIKIKDDVLSKETQDYFEYFAKTNIPWFYHEEISGTEKVFKDKNWKPSGGFTHVAYHDGKINSSFFNNDFS